MGGDEGRRRRGERKRKRRRSHVSYKCENSERSSHETRTPPKRLADSEHMSIAIGWIQ